MNVINEILSRFTAANWLFLISGLFCLISFYFWIRKKSQIEELKIEQKKLEQQTNELNESRYRNSMLLKDIETQRAKLKDEDQRLENKRYEYKIFDI